MDKKVYKQLIEAYNQLDPKTKYQINKALIEQDLFLFQKVYIDLSFILDPYIGTYVFYLMFEKEDKELLHKFYQLFQTQQFQQKPINHIDLWRELLFYQHKDLFILSHDALMENYKLLANAKDPKIKTTWLLCSPIFSSLVFLKLMLLKIVVSWAVYDAKLSFVNYKSLFNNNLLEGVILDQPITLTINLFPFQPVSKNALYFITYLLLFGFDPRNFKIEFINQPLDSYLCNNYKLYRIYFLADYTSFFNLPLVKENLELSLYKELMLLDQNLKISDLQSKLKSDPNSIFSNSSTITEKDITNADDHFTKCKFYSLKLFPNNVPYQELKKWFLQLTTNEEINNEFQKIEAIINFYTELHLIEPLYLPKKVFDNLAETLDLKIFP